MINDCLEEDAQHSPHDCIMGRAPAGDRARTLDMNFLHTPRMSWDRVAENIMTCLSWGVILKIS